MSADESVPTREEWEREIKEDPEGYLEWVEWSISAIPEWEWNRRHIHDRDAYLCHGAGSTACKALGHPADPDGDAFASRDAYVAAVDAWDELHPRGWGRERICLETRYAAACSFCESEDCPFGPPADLWSLPGVTR